MITMTHNTITQSNDSHGAMQINLRRLASKDHFTWIFKRLLVVKGEARQGHCSFYPKRNRLGGGFALELSPDVHHEVEEEDSAANVNGQR